MKVGIIGGAGYTAGELIRILINHPEVSNLEVISLSHAAEPVSAVHTDLIGDTNLVFGKELTSSPDVLFLCQGHGKAVAYLESAALSKDTKVIDLGNDFRLAESATFENREFVYGLPELQREKIKAAQNVANPGCFATSIELALLPLAQPGFLDKNSVSVTAITGSTGAGQNPSPTTHFSWRQNNLSVYKAFEHQHLDEIKQSLGNPDAEINFVPIRGNHARGILASVFLPFTGSQEEAQQMYNTFYADQPFTHVVKQSPDMKSVVNTNKCLLHVQKHGSQLHIVSVIDNLTKGASGQAVQNMNIMFGFNEATGLQLKPNAF